MRRLTPQEMATLTNALTVAAQQFHVRTEELQRIIASPVQPGIIDLIRALERQEKDTRALLEVIEGATVDVTPAEYSPGDCGPECGGTEP